MDFNSYVLSNDTKGGNDLYLMVEGMRCASCAWSIESALNAEEGVNARINLSTRRLSVHWQGAPERANVLAEKILALGYSFSPFDPGNQQGQDRQEERFLLKCIAVSGFVSGNLMILSLALWFSDKNSMGGGTRDLMHWVSALLCMPAIFYAGIPYYTSAWNAIKCGRTNMDVPITLAIALATGMSLWETFRHGEYVYFDSSVMLLFFLLIGRYLDKKARGRARAAAEGLLATMQGSATIREHGKQRTLLIRDLQPRMCLLVAMGEKIAADGVIVSGQSHIDTSPITGETVPEDAKPGTKVFAGTLNISAPIEVEVLAATEQSVLADIIRLMEKAEQGQAQYVRLADQVASWYTPAVHILALATFIGWIAVGLAWQKALLIATTVLVITCPCALGLAVPVVQVLASGRLFRQGMLLKSGDALERLATIDTVIFDKTGTLTLGKPQLTNMDEIQTEDMQLAASLAVHSKHPLSRAVGAAWHGDVLSLEAKEEPGRGLSGSFAGKEVRLGSRSWCGDTAAETDDSLELWLAMEGRKPIRFAFADILRSDARQCVKYFIQRGIRVELLSGDRESVVRSTAETLGISEFAFKMTPPEKSAHIQKMTQQGRRVLMVGDGLNDAPSLATAHVSISPSSAIDITQNAADIIFQGEKLSSVVLAWQVAIFSMKLVKQNFALSFLYNLLAIPLAIMGFVTPMIAAIAMSSSSIIVIANAMRINLLKGEQ